MTVVPLNLSEIGGRSRSIEGVPRTIIWVFWAFTFIPLLQNQRNSSVSVYSPPSPVSVCSPPLPVSVCSPPPGFLTRRLGLILSPGRRGGRRCRAGANARSVRPHPARLSANYLDWTSASELTESRCATVAAASAPRTARCPAAPSSSSAGRSRPPPGSRRSPWQEPRQEAWPGRPPEAWPPLTNGQNIIVGVLVVVCLVWPAASPLAETRGETRFLSGGSL